MISEIRGFLKLAIKNITHRQLRSWLTIIGVIIGIAAIVSLISISNGMEHAITEQFESFGTDMITITPKSFQGPSGSFEGAFDSGDVSVLRRITELDLVLPMVSGNVEVEFHNQKAYTMIMGYDSNDDAERVFEEMGFEPADGRFPDPDESNVVAIGHIVAYDMFDDVIRVNNRIKLDGETFKVVGIAEEVGNQQDDVSIFMPVDDAMELLDKTEYSFIMAVVKDGVDVDETADKIERKLERYRDKEDFQVLTFSEIMETIGMVLGIIQLVLVGIAGISLLVGAVGIMNTTYTAVLERTKEIGIMKAVGATNHQILMIFLIESGVIGLVGGVIGAIIGTGIAQGVSLIASNMALPMPLAIQIEWGLIAFSITFAFGLGMIAGFLPAWSAANLKPADSLRYE